MGEVHMTEFKQDDAAFAALDELGYISDYVEVRKQGDGSRLISPAWPAAQLRAQGFYIKGTKVRFINANGYEGERSRALEQIGIDRQLTVIFCYIGSSSSDYEFEEVSGRWNTVMFDKVPDKIGEDLYD